MNAHTRLVPRAVALYAGAVLAAISAAAPASAQEQVPPVDSLRAEIAALRAQLDSLRARIGGLEAAGAAGDTLEAEVPAEDPLAAIRAAAAAAAATADTAPGADTATAPEFEGRERNLSVFNPEISVTGDVLALVDSDDASGGSMLAREFELAFQSNLDPYSRAKIFVAHHEPGGDIMPFSVAEDEEEEAEVEVEEGYVEWVGLPGGLGVQFGKFRQRFGTLNRWHQHALPAQMLPLPYLAFFGEEGLAQIGATLHWLVPMEGFGTYEVWGELTRADNELLFGGDHGLNGLVHVNGFWQLSPSTYFELGLSGLAGSHSGIDAGDAFGSRVYGVDFSFNWRPPAQALYREFSLRGGWLANQCDTSVCPASGAWGAFGIGEYRLNQRWLVGARIEYAEDPADPNRHAWLAAPTLTWWQSEFVRLRAEYDLLDRPAADRFGQFLIQATFAMGPHKHEIY